MKILKYTMTGSSREFYGTGTNFFRYRYRYFFPGPIFSGTGTGTIQKGAKFPGLGIPRIGMSHSGRRHRNRRGSSSMCSTLNCFKQVNVIQEWDLIEGPLGGDTRDYIAVYIAPVYLSPVRDLRWQGSSCLQRTSASGSGAPVTVTDSGD